MRALLVIDMQEDYVGKKRNRKQFPYQSETLIAEINQRISEYRDAEDLVIYILNRFFYQGRTYTPQPVEGLSMASPWIFQKKRANCFSNLDLLQLLRSKEVTEVEMVGVDGNYCVGVSALAGKKNGFWVMLDCQCIGIGNKNRFRKTIRKLKSAGVTLRQPQLCSLAYGLQQESTKSQY